MTTIYILTCQPNVRYLSRSSSNLFSVIMYLLDIFVFSIKVRFIGVITSQSRNYVLWFALDKFTKPCFLCVYSVLCVYYERVVCVVCVHCVLCVVCVLWACSLCVHCVHCFVFVLYAVCVCTLLFCVCTCVACSLVVFVLCLWTLPDVHCNPETEGGLPF